MYTPERGCWRSAERQRAFEGGYDAARVIVLVRLGDLRVRQGRLEEAAALLQGLDQVPDAVRPLAALHLARGETALARDLLERRLAAPPTPMPWPIATTRPPPPPVAAPLLALLVDAHLADRDVTAASAAADRLTELATRHPSPYVAACAALARGLVCLASASDDAGACLRDALEAFSRAQMPVETARARLELARAIAAERPEVAAAEAKTAMAAFETRRAARDADAAAALLRSLGGSGRTAPRIQGELTSREREVLALLAEGLSNAEIAERLVISTKTAEHHVGRILRKLDLKSRAQAAAYALREGGSGPGSK